MYSQYKEVRRRSLVSLITGLSLILLFVVLRKINIYGDPAPWSVQKTGWFTFLSFINTTKYPPSLLYLCMTIGPALVFLSAAERMRGPVARFITVYGRVPFFYYLLHFYLLHLLCVILYLSRGHSFASGINGIPGFPFHFVIPGEGYSLAIVYLIWIAVFLSLYPLCKWYGAYKRRSGRWWVKYI